MMYEQQSQLEKQNTETDRAEPLVEMNEEYMKVPRFAKTWKAYQKFCQETNVPDNHHVIEQFSQ